MGHSTIVNLLTIFTLSFFILTILIVLGQLGYDRGNKASHYNSFQFSLSRILDSKRDIQCVTLEKLPHYQKINQHLTSQISAISTLTDTFPLKDAHLRHQFKAFFIKVRQREITLLQ